MADPPRQYDDSNRAFWQAFHARGSWTFEEARPVLAAILSVKAALHDGEDAEPIPPEDVTMDEFEAYLGAAADVASKYDYQIRSTVHQVSRERVWAITNTTSDLLTQDATTYTADELSFVRRLLDAMFEEHNTPRIEAMCVTSMQAMRLARPRPTRQSRGANPNSNSIILDGGEPSTPSVTQTQTQTQTQSQTDKGLRLSDVERMMSTLVAGGWLELSEEGFYSLSARALLELRAWLLETYNDADAAADEWQRIKPCEACREIVTVGQRCDNRDCVVRLHNVCEDAYWRSRRERMCPRCGTAWEGGSFVGERAVTSGKLYRRSGGSGGGGRRSQGAARRRRSTADETIREAPDETGYDEEVE